MEEGLGYKYDNLNIRPSPVPGKQLACGGEVTGRKH